MNISRFVSDASAKTWMASQDAAVERCRAAAALSDVAAPLAIMDGMSNGCTVWFYATMSDLELDLEARTYSRAVATVTVAADGTVTVVP